MKKTMIAVIAVSMSVSVMAQGIEFESSTFGEALAKAQSENKLLFMDCYTTWCGPCKKMSKEVFPQKEVGDYINANFVSIKIDMEKGEGIKLAKRYDIKAFPTLLFMDANGKVLHTKVGGADAKGFLAEAKIAFDPSKQFDYLEAQYKAGKRDLKLVASYIKGLYDKYRLDDLKAVGEQVIPTISFNQYNTETAFTILAFAGVEFRSEPYNYILNNKEIFITNEDIGQQSWDYLISNAISNYVLKFAKEGTEEELKAAIQLVKEDFVSPRQEMSESQWYGAFYIANEEFDKWFDSNMANAEKQSDPQMKSSMVINTAYRIAMDPVFEGNDKIYKRAIDATEKAKTEDEGFLATYYCLASLYKKTGNKDAALKNVNEFIDRNSAKGGNEDPRVINLKAEIEKM